MCELVDLRPTALMYVVSGQFR